MTRTVKDTHQKALAINLDLTKYGTIAEIGAGQETARWFFRAGGAAGTIAKAMSAYDMKFSDAIYGTSPRYVGRERLHAMLKTEYNLLIERLDAHRGENNAFFAFSNTVAARSFLHKTDGHGWLGIRFQTEPRGEPSQIDVHINLHGTKSLQDQETIGMLGVNLIYGALILHSDPEELLDSMMDQMYTELVEIDMIEFSGPAFAKVDNRLMALRLVQKGMSNAAMFTADGHVVQVADALYKKAVLIERSRFRPPTRLTVSLIESAKKAFFEEFKVGPNDLIVLSEMTLNNLVEGGDIDVEDFLNRVDILCALGKNVLISNYGEYFRLAQYLFSHTKLPIGMAMGVPSLRELFNEKYYEQLPGGILESCGRLFKNDLKLFVCPVLDPDSGQRITFDTMDVPDNLRHLYAYLLENGYIKGLNNVRDDYLKIFSHEVLEKIRCGDDSWEPMVPEEVAAIIKERKLFHCRG